MKITTHEVNRAKNKIGFIEVSILQKLLTVQTQISLLQNDVIPWYFHGFSFDLFPGELWVVSSMLIPFKKFGKISKKDFP